MHLKITYKAYYNLAMLFSHYVPTKPHIIVLTSHKLNTGRRNNLCPQFPNRGKRNAWKKKEKKEKGIFISFKETHYIH